MPIAAAIQMNSSINIDDNLQQAEKLIEQAVIQKAEFIVLPEMFATVGLTPDESLQQAEFFGAGKLQDFLANIAKKYNVWLAGGTIPIRNKENNRAHNTCLVFNHQGHLMARYDKIHLFDVVVKPGIEEYKESINIQAGAEITTLDTPIGKVGLSICYDIRFPELFRNLFNRGAEIILVPAAFAVKTGQAHWQLLTRARAVENSCYVIGAGETGKHNEQRETYGHSLIIDPWGAIISSLENGIGVITANIDLDFLKQVRRNMPMMEHQQIFTTR